MTEYWKSQAKKFCDFCKCWIADNKASITFHENGRRHQQAVENKLYDIKRRGRKDEKKASAEKKWLEEIEQKAMNDYRSKDLGNNADITARVFNQKRAERDAQREDDEDGSSDRARTAAQLAALEAQMAPQIPGPSKGPMVGPQIAAPSSWLKKIQAPTSGTKWHNAPGTKKWHEAKTDEGHIYYWHIETFESRWEAPAEGYVSIKEQHLATTESNQVQEMPVSDSVVEQRKSKQAQESFIKEKLKGKKFDKFPKPEIKSSIPSSTSTSENTNFATEGPVARGEPYGAWKTVETKETVLTPIDYQVPQVKEAPQANVTMHSDRLTKFEEKKTPSLGGATTHSSKPAIVFRKRKINEEHRKNARKREDDE